MRCEINYGERGAPGAMCPTCLSQLVFMSAIKSRAPWHFYFCMSPTESAQELIGGGKLRDDVRHGGAMARCIKIKDFLCVPHSGSSNTEFVLAAKAMSVGFCRFAAGCADPDLEGGSFLDGGRREGTCVRACELRRVRLGDPLVDWSGVLTVYVAVTDTSGQLERTRVGDSVRSTACRRGKEQRCCYWRSRLWLP